MARQFKFRYVNEIVGAFVLAVVIMLVVGVIFAGHYQGWFTPRYKLILTFPPEGSLGLKRGSEVEILGSVVGMVQKIDIDEQDHMSGEVEIVGNWFRFVRTDSKVKIAKRYGVAGDAFVTVTKGSGARLEDGDKLAAEKDTELIEMAQELVNQVRESTIPLLGQFRVTAEEFGGLASDLRSSEGPIIKTTDNISGLIADLRGSNGPVVKLDSLLAQMKSGEGPLMKTLSNLDAITAGLKNGDGTVGKLLRDPATLDEVNRVIRQVSNALAEVQGILGDVKKTTVQLPPLAAKVGREADDLPGLVLQIQQTLIETERLIEGVQKHWLLRSNIPQPAATELIPPSEVTTPGARKP